MTDDLVAAADRLLARGLRPVLLHAAPGGVCTCGRATCKKSAGKHPVRNAWQNHDWDERDRSEAEDQPRNLGLRMGGDSRVIAIDLDGPEGQESWQALQLTHGPWAPTLTQTTGSGGTHYLYRVPDGHPMPSNAVRIRPGIDIRSDGGQIVVHPSGHRSGRRYEWQDPEASIAELTAEQAALVCRVRTENRPAQPLPYRPPPEQGGESKRALVALQRESAEIAGLATGRHNAIYVAAIKLGHLVAAGEITEGFVVDSLLDAAKACGEIQDYGEADVCRCIRDGLTVGKRDLPRVPLHKDVPRPTNGSGLHLVGDDPVEVEERAAIQGETRQEPPPMPGDDEKESVPARRLVMVGDLIDAALDQAERRQRGDEKPVPLPWASVAECHGGGYWPGVYVEVASTGKGKSQKALEEHAYAAQLGIPSGYIGLELDANQIALRVLAAVGKLPWSKLWLGQCDERLIQRARELAPRIKELPIACEYADPLGWPASRLIDFGKRFRDRFPDGPGLITLDFMQLVADEPGDRRDLRERIGRAAYASRALVDMGLSVKLVSSTARDKYALLSSPAKAAGLVTTHTTGRIGAARRILCPDVLVGLAKEAGEVEFSADSVATLIQWPEPLDNGSRAVLYAVPKCRALPASWCALAFNGFGFEELPITSLDDLPEPGEGGQGSIATDEYVDRVVATLRNAKQPVKTKREILGQTKGEYRRVSSAVDQALSDGRIERGADGVFRIVAQQEESAT